MSECPSKSWDRYYDSMESAEAEVIHEWIADQIEHTKNRIGGEQSILRDHFDPKDGWPQDPSEIADEITNLICDSGILVEAIMLLAKVNRKGEKK